MKKLAILTLAVTPVAGWSCFCLAADRLPGQSPEQRRAESLPHHVAINDAPRPMSAELRSGGEAPIQLAEAQVQDPAVPDSQPNRETLADDESPIDADALLRSTRDRLRVNQPLRAKLRETVRIGERRLKAEGSYVQGENLKLRLELKVNAAPSVEGFGGSLLEVCDGQVLWTRLTIGDSTRFTRRDVTQILKAAQESGAIAENVLIAELGLGGLPALLASIEQTMTFRSVQRKEIDGRPFSIVEGTWSADFRKGLLGADATASTPLPEHVPDAVRIYLDEELFPHRILYLKNTSGEDQPRPMVALDFYDVELKTEVDDQQFRFAPPQGILPDELTNAYIERFKAAADRKKEADDGDDSAGP